MIKNLSKIVIDASIFLVVILLFLPILGCSNSASPSSAPITTTATSVQTSPVAPSSSAALSPSPSPVQTTPRSSVASITINIQAAASLTDVLKELDNIYTQSNPNIALSPNFASSGTLQQQIEQGAPADIFISAASAQMDTLQKENLIVTATRKNLLNNTLVVVVPNDSALGITNLKDLAGNAVRKIAIGDPKSVPAGTYAQQAFDELGITAQVQNKLILGADVRGVLNYVESGNVDAGLVYLTDAKTSSKVKVVANAPADINAKIVYPVAVVTASKNPDAANKYESFLFSDQAKAVFDKYGFTIVNQ